MILSTIVKVKSEPLTWRHFVLAAYWLITVIPMIILIGAGWLAEVGDNTLGRLRKWANPVSSNWRGKEWRNYDYTEGGEW